MKHIGIGAKRPLWSSSRLHIFNICFVFLCSLISIMHFG